LLPRERDESEYACDCVDSCLGPKDGNIGCFCADYYAGCNASCPCYNAWGDHPEESTQVRLPDGKLPWKDMDYDRKCYINQSLQERYDDMIQRQGELRSEHCYAQTLTRFGDEIEIFRENSGQGYAQKKKFNLNIFQDTWEETHRVKGSFVIALEDPPWVRSAGSGKLALATVALLFGNESAAILRYQPDNERVPLQSTNSFYLQDFSDIFSRNALQVPLLHTYFHEREFVEYFKSLRALSTAAEVYKLVPNATIDLGISSRPLHSSFWASSVGQSGHPSAYSFKLDRRTTFACIAYLDSGWIDIQPNLLTDVMAMSSGNSIFVTSTLLCDPSETPADHEIKRVVGNIGRAGIAMLISPQHTKTRKLDSGSWKVINHAPYNGKPEDCFKSTSLHLSFTPYTQPINIGDHGLQDTEVYFIESVVSVHDREKWVADIDILKTLASPLFSRLVVCSNCTHIDDGSLPELISVDNWEELLDMEKAVSGVVRARANWLARLAAAAISIKQGQRTVVLPNSVCWGYVRESLNGLVDEIYIL
jgi:hypothetical protein